MTAEASVRTRSDVPTPSRRFALVASVFGLIYGVLAALGPYGIVPVPVWPEVAQQLLQTRAWLGEDIVAETQTGEEVLEVEPRLDVTPYIAHRVVRDPREESLVANLACAVRTGPGRGDLVPLQEVQARGRVTDEVLRDKVECFVGFPPGPAALLLPVRALFGELIPVQLVAALLGGLGVAVMDRLFALATDLGRGPAPATAGDQGVRLELTVLAGVGTLWVWAVPQATTWLFAQTVATSALAAAVLQAARGRPWSSGAALALAVASRPPMLLAVPLLVALVVERQASGTTPRPLVLRWVSSAMTRLLVAPGVAIASMGTLNWLRFGSPGDFGYRHMLTPPVLLERMLAHGQLSIAFLGENLRYLFLEPPRLLAGFPFLVSDPWGMGILFVTPAVMVAVGDAFRSARRGLKAVAWLSAAAIAAPALLYFNTGWVQWGGRFLLDSWPLWLLLIAWGWRSTPVWLRRSLLVLSVASNLWGALLTATRVWPGCCM